MSLSFKVWSQHYGLYHDIKICGSSRAGPVVQKKTHWFDSICKNRLDISAISDAVSIYVFISTSCDSALFPEWDGV